MTARLRYFYRFLKMCCRVFIVWFLGHHFAQPRGQAERSRDEVGMSAYSLPWVHAISLFLDLKRALYGRKQSAI